VTAQPAPGYCTCGAPMADGTCSVFASEEHDELARLEATAPAIDPNAVAPSLETLLAGTEFADALPPAAEADNAGEEAMCECGCPESDHAAGGNGCYDCQSCWEFATARPAVSPRISSVRSNAAEPRSTAVSPAAEADDTAEDKRWREMRDFALAFAQDRLRRGVLTVREIGDALDLAYEEGRDSCRPAASPAAVGARQDEQLREARLTITSGWLVEEVDEHTCGTDRDGYYGHHEPSCGQIPVMEVGELVALFDTLTALGIPINLAPQDLAPLLAAQAAVQRVEELLRTAPERRIYQSLIRRALDGEP
jgi:hypothetical protein